MEEVETVDLEWINLGCPTSSGPKSEHLLLFSSGYILKLSRRLNGAQLLANPNETWDFREMIFVFSGGGYFR